MQATTGTLFEIPRGIKGRLTLKISLAKMPMRNTAVGFPGWLWIDNEEVCAHFHDVTFSRGPTSSLELCNLWRKESCSWFLASVIYLPFQFFAKNLIHLGALGLARESDKICLGKWLEILFPPLRWCKPLQSQSLELPEMQTGHWIWEHLDSCRS